MGYLASDPQSAAYVTDTFSGTGSTSAYTMSVAPASTSSMLVAIHGVVQDPSTYAIVGMTLNFSAAPPAGTGNISVRYLGIPASGIANTAYRTVSEYTANAGQTTWTVPSYTVGFIDVYRNGVQLGSTDFTATNGTSIALTVAANANDFIRTVSFNVSSVLNAIPATPNSVLPYIGNRALAASQMPAGSVIQVVSTTKTDTFSSSSTSFVDVTGLVASITPSSATSKILVTASLSCGGGWSGSYTQFLRLARGGVGLGIGAGGSSAYVQSGAQDFETCASLSCLDSPATTATTTYSVQSTCDNPIAVYINRAITRGNATSSTITLMEIAA